MRRLLQSLRSVSRVIDYVKKKGRPVVKERWDDSFSINVKGRQEDVIRLPA